MKYLSLFSGIGGFELGIQKSKWNEKLECIGYSEIDKYADSIYRRHFPKHTSLGDVTQIDPKELENFDLLVAGFPCQAFSIAGKGRGFEDTRGTLFFEIARICAEKRPKYLLLENVKGLLSHNKGETFKTIVRVLTDLGYDIEWKIYNSKSYGVPQNRERLFIKGYFRERCSGEVLSLSRTSTENNAEIELIKYGNQNGRIYGINGVSTCLNRNGTTEFYDVKSYRDKKRTYSIYDDPEQTISRTITGDGQNCGNRHIIKLNNKAQGQSVYDPNGISCTLTGCGGGQGGKTGLYDVKSLGNVNPDFLMIRRLTPRECERLQGFPDDWTQYGVDDEKISDTQRYKCVGNAVTVNVVEYIFNNWHMW